MADVSVVVVTWNALPWLERCLESVRGHATVVVAHGSGAAEHQRRGMTHVHAELAGSALLELDGCRHDAPTSHSQLFADVVVGAAAGAAGEPWSSAFSRSAEGRP